MSSYFENNLTCKAPLVGSRSNRFWKDLKSLQNINRAFMFFCNHSYGIYFSGINASN